MKKTLASALLVLPFVFAFTGERGQKSPAPYYVNYCKPDKSLKSTEAKIVFQFTSDYSGVVKDSVLMSYNGISKTLHCDSTGHATLMVKPGKYKFLFWLDFTHQEIYSDSIVIKPAHETGINVWFTNTHYIMEADKPVIYVYPDATTQVQLMLDVQGQVGFTYPAFNADRTFHNTEQGWEFTADTNGTIHMNGKEYDYLFWDARIPFSAERPMETTGFVVERDSLTTFFEQKLTAMGLNAREKQDFITYWCPLMQKYEKSFVHFMFTEEYDSIASINITPKPDHLFRVFMVWRDATRFDYTQVHPQEIPSVTREGFTVIEWGGAEISAQSSVRSSQ